MQLEVGDRVQIRKDLIKEKRYDGYLFNEFMVKFAGRFATVEFVRDDGSVLLDADHNCWPWSAEMLIQLASSSCPCGILGIGLQAEEVTMLQYREREKKDPVLSRKYFRRYKYCPDCARLIDWGQAE